MKRWHLEKLLDSGMTMVHLDARQDEVSVPPQHLGDPHLRLNLSYRFKPCDLELSDEEIRVTLSFGGQPWACRLPFAAVFGMTSHVTGESLMWLEDVPEEVLSSLVGSDSAGTEPEPAQELRALRAVEGGGQALRARVKTPPPQLRLVK